MSGRQAYIKHLESITASCAEERKAFILAIEGQKAMMEAILKALELSNASVIEHTNYSKTHTVEHAEMLGMMRGKQ